jgi:REP-associated tyrosine transposase
VPHPLARPGLARQRVGGPGTHVTDSELRSVYGFRVPTGLKRYYGTGQLHYITCSCYRRRQMLATQRRRNAFCRVLEEVRQKYGFVVVGYVVMPEHFHLLMSEPEIGDPSKVMQVLKQRVARRLLRRRKPFDWLLWEEREDDRQFWQTRFYDFNVWSKGKRIEKLNYMHANPVRRKVERPELWAWSSYRAHVLGEEGLVHVSLSWPEKKRAA